MPNKYGAWNTIREAQMVLEESYQDCVLDMGESTAQEGWGDIVRSVAENCTDEIRSEFLRRNGVEEL